MSRYSPSPWPLSLGYLLIFAGVLVHAAHSPDSWPFWATLIKAILGWFIILWGLARVEKDCYTFGMESGFRGQWGAAIWMEEFQSLSGILPAQNYWDAQGMVDNLNWTSSPDVYARVVRRNYLGKWKPYTPQYPLGVDIDTSD